MAILNANLIDGDIGLTRTVLQKTAEKRAPVVVTPPNSPKRSSKSTSKPKPKSTSKPKAPAKPAASSGGGGGSSGIKNSTDKAQLDALNELLKSGFAKARDVKIGNIQNAYRRQDASLLESYRERMKGLERNLTDNEKAEHDASFANLSNRSRESLELFQQAAVQGAGETDMLRSQLMAIRNWQSNQADVNRSYFDTLSSVNSAITDLNQDTKTARWNLADESWGDQEQVWANYYNQRADAYTQLGNMSANPYSDQHGKAKDAYANMAKEASTSWKRPTTQKGLTGWEGDRQPKDARLNNTGLNTTSGVQTLAKPTGTLRRW